MWEQLLMPFPKEKRSRSANQRYGSQLFKIYQYIQTHPGCTGYEIAQALAIKSAQIHPHLRQLTDIQKRVYTQHKPVAPERRGPNSTHSVKTYWAFDNTVTIGGSHG